MARIMAVDNEPDTVAMIKKMLEGEGYKVSTALSGKSCLKKLGKEKPNLVLLDIMMPDLSGWDVYQRIRKKNKKVKVAFISVIEVSPERKRRLRKEGVSGYIMKPFTREELIEEVKAILGK